MGFAGKPNANEGDLNVVQILSAEQTYLVEVSGSNHGVSVSIRDCFPLGNKRERNDCTRFVNHKRTLSFNSFKFGDRPMVPKLHVYASDKFYKAAPASVYDFDFTWM